MSQDSQPRAVVPGIRCKGAGQRTQEEEERKLFFLLAWFTWNWTVQRGVRAPRSPERRPETLRRASRSCPGKLVCALCLIRSGGVARFDLHLFLPSAWLQGAPGQIPQTPSSLQGPCAHPGPPQADAKLLNGVSATCSCSIFWANCSVGVVFSPLLF